MSYRELRNFKEIMCTLGYPRLISIENFKVPHFELVADILVWLCHRYDKNMEVLDEIRTEHDRVAFLKSVAEQLLVKARVKLNLKNLYASNGFAVRELLKIATLLHDAHRNAGTEEGDDDDTAPADIGAGHKFSDIKLTRSLAADITKYGSRLHELLGTHHEAKEGAARALGKNFQVDDLQRQLSHMNSQVAEQTENLRSMLNNLASDEASLQQRIDKKKAELDRNEKRFASLKAVRPAFMDEYERLEVELSAHYSMYVQAWRNMSYLESEMDELNANEEDRIAENDRQLKMMQRRLREEELRVLRGQTKVDERALDEALMAGRDESRGKTMKRPQGAASVRRDGRSGSGGSANGEFGGGDLGGAGNMYGGMAPIEDEEESDEEGDDEGEGESELEGEDEEDSDGQVEFTHDDGDDDDMDGDDGLDDFGEDGEEDDDF